jgi:hypothetical protein
MKATTLLLGTLSSAVLLHAADYDELFENWDTSGSAAAAVSAAPATDPDNASLDPEASPQRPWSLLLVGGNSAGETSLRDGSLIVAREFGTAWHDWEFTATPSVAWTGYQGYAGEGTAQAAVEPQLQAAWYTHRMALNGAVWYSQVLDLDNTDPAQLQGLGMDASLLFGLFLWDSGRLMLGPIAGSSPLVDDYAGLQLSAEHSWSLGEPGRGSQLRHGPALRLEARAALDSETPSGRGGSSFRAMGTYLGDLSYGLSRLSQDGRWSTDASVGYTMDLTPSGGKRMQEATGVGEGLWGRAALGWHW